MATKRFEPQVQLDNGLTIPALAGSGKVLTSDSSGNATWQLPSGIIAMGTAARAYRNAAWSTAGAGDVKVALDTKSFDPGNNFSTANSQYTCPTTGYYHVSGTICFNPGATTAAIESHIVKNGTVVSRGDLGSWTYLAGISYGFPVSDIIFCSAGDTLELHVYTQSGLTGVPGADLTYMSVVQVDGPVLGNADGLQNGVLNSGDLLVSTISINTGTGALTFTPASGTVWVKSAAGALARNSFVSQAFTPAASAPATTKYAVVGVEIDTSGAISIIKGTDTATQLNTGSLIASNSPATSSGKMRIADFAIWNNAGVFNFSDHTTVATQGTNWIDRRPWARGALYNNNPAASASTSSTSMVTITPASDYSCRLECTGVPIQAKFTGVFSNPTSGGVLQLQLFNDTTGGQQYRIGPAPDVISGFRSTIGYDYTFTPSAGSHLFTWQFATATGTITISSHTLNFTELVRQNTSNGTA